MDIKCHIWDSVFISLPLKGNLKQVLIYSAIIFGLALNNHSPDVMGQTGSPSAEDDFNFLKDFAVPVAAALIIGVTASWAFIQSWWRGHYFRRLIMRELRELEPNITTIKDKPLKDCMNRRFIHKEILEKPTENKEFIFSIKPGIIYHTSQIWYAFKSDDKDNFIKHFCELSEDTDDENIKDACKKWIKLFKEDGIFMDKKTEDTCNRL